MKTVITILVICLCQIANAAVTVAVPANAIVLEAQQTDGTWKAIITGTTIGAGKELKFAPVTAKKFRLNILQSSETPTIDELQLIP